MISRFAMFCLPMLLSGPCCADGRGEGAVYLVDEPFGSGGGGLPQGWKVFGKQVFVSTQDFVSPPAALCIMDGAASVSHPAHLPQVNIPFPRITQGEVRFSFHFKTTTDNPALRVYLRNSRANPVASLVFRDGLLGVEQPVGSVPEGGVAPRDGGMPRVWKPLLPLPGGVWHHVEVIVPGGKADDKRFSVIVSEAGGEARIFSGLLPLAGERFYQSNWNFASLMINALADGRQTSWIDNLQVLATE
ncbi:MAG: hypothetical protein LBK99_22375 [Opitutaceae bacterium]|jgi:hypothetical protein|nr:hypothetical protein [Opitutaceae bacterium]